ncbi:hypothetical protein WJX72_011789 [[Myrmecia] bisecta]|uniref:Uncharacterized protein n=1 Tax=[Myrmecia] bisecta TaxID=41462 RepID=A0AAW1PPY9_9CHLO
MSLLSRLTSRPGGAVRNLANSLRGQRNRLSSSELHRVPQLKSSTKADTGFSETRDKAKAATLRNIWSAYNRRLATHPVPTKSLTCLVGSFLGDVLAQVLSGSTFDPSRTLKMSVFAFAWGGPSGHYWNLFLDRVIMPHRPHSMAAVVAKMAVDQLLFCPLGTCIFFSYLKLVEGRPDLIVSFIQEKLVKTLLANYALWPAAVLIGFRFVPTDLRILYGNCIGVVWGAYVSFLAHQPISGEAYPPVRVAKID